jgi:hypothetical protein
MAGKKRMKLRIHGNNVRIRLTQGEVRNFARGESLEQTTEFSTSSSFTTRIEIAEHAKHLIAVFDGGRLTVRLAPDLVRRWAQTNQVGIEMNQPIRDGTSLSILIEKDFDCIHPAPGENIDTFPNPKRLV